MENAYSSLDQSRSFLQHNPLARLLTAGLLLPCLTLWGPGLQANPSGGAVVLGDVTIGTGAGGQLDITQGSDRAIIHWDDFSIDAGQTTRFIQPGTSSIALNRVTGGNPTAIFGALQGNGHVFVINPNGILVGAGGTIDVHGLALSTLDVSNGEFLAGGELLFQGGTQTGVTNMGRINAIGGDVFLIGKTVSNSGSISARDGTVGLAAGEEVLLTAANGPEAERLFVRAGGAGVSGTGIFNDGTIEGAAVELKAHGNVYAMAINNKGSIRAIGTDTSGGRVFLQGAGGRVSNSGLISSRSGDPNKAASLLIQAAYAKVDGELIAANAAGIGGNITVEGTETVEVGSNARIDASGSAGGGSVRIGGGFQGRDVSMANAKNTTVAEGSLIIADATESGDAGTVIVWADQDTVYEGEISAQAAGVGNGGFVEVSGKENLTFDGVVSTLSVSGRNGTLLLDPTNLTVSTAAASANNVNATSLTTAVGSNNVVISTDPAGTQDGNITVSNDVLYTSTNSLTFLAHGDAIFNASVQNAGTGAVNIVAGWNGTTGFAAASPFGLQNGAGFNLATILAAPASFGNAKPNGGNGSVRIDSSVGSTAAIVAVASRGGTTTVLGHGLTLQSGSATGIDATQLGFRPTDNTQVTGAIDIYLKAGGLSILGGTTDDFAQIGHGGTGSFASAGVNAPITVSFVETGDVNLVTSTSSNNHAQIGHGGRSQISTVAGAITIRGIGGVAGASNLTLSSRGQLAYAQIGHGGFLTSASSGVIDGNVCVVTGTTLSLGASGGAGSYSQIGHGGVNRQGNFSGDVVVTTGIAGAGAVSLAGGTASNAYAQIGHGGINANGLLSGDIYVVADRTGMSGGDISITGGSLTSTYGMIGHGDSEGVTSRGRREGGIHLFAAGDFTVTNGSGGPNTNYYHQTGNTGGLAANYDGGDGFQVVVNGTTSVASSAEDDVNFFIADSLGSGPVFIQRSDDFNVLIDDQDRFVDTSSDFFIVTGGSITLLRSYQNSGTGRVILVAGWDGGGTLSPGTVSYAALGGGGFNYCLPSITAGRRDVDFTNGASFGNEIDGGDALFGTVTIGSADQNNPVVVGSRGGDTVILGYGLTVAAGDSVGAYSQIGFRPNASGAVASDINIRLKQGGLTLAGGTAGGTAAFAQIGHGGATTSATGILEGDITIDFSNPGALQLSGGANPFAYAQIGHGGGNARGSEFRGDISIRGASDVGLIAGTLTATYAQIGHGGYSTDVNQSGKIEVFSLGEINLSATPPASPATAFSAYALIGHGDDVRGTIAVFAGTGTRAGNVQVGAGTNLTLTSASIGHGSAATGSVAGTTEVAVSQNAPSDPSGGNLIADAHSELSSGSASGDALQFYLPQRSNNLIAAGATLNGESFLGAGVDPTDVLREDEFTLSIIGPGGPVVPTAAQLAGTFGAGAAPINAARFAFNHDTVQLRASSTRPLSTIGRFNNDRTINEDRRDDEADYTGFEPVRFFYEGFDQYDWSGASSYKGGMVPAP